MKKVKDHKEGYFTHNDVALLLKDAIAKQASNHNVNRDFLVA